MLRQFRFAALILTVAAGVLAEDPTTRPVFLAAMPALSPDGKTLAFSWNEDIWTVPSEGGTAKRFTQNPGYDYRAAFSPDGKHLAFGSNRNGRWNIYVAPTAGGEPRQISYHSDGESLLGWSSDGKSVLYLAQRDHAGRFGHRLFLKSADGKGAEKVLFNAMATGGAMSADGTKILFMREGNSPYRKGYVGSKASQIWLYDRTKKTHKKLLAEEYDCRDPMWQPDGSGFYFMSAKGGVQNLWHYSMRWGKRKQLTTFKDDSAMNPTISRDGSTIIFRRLFDFYRFKPATMKVPEKIEIHASPKVFPIDRQLKTFKTATAVTYAHDNLEIAFVAGGDLWVMDTVMKEPVRVVESPDRVHDSIFSKDHSILYYILGDGIKSNVFQATRADAKKAWWENREFKLKQVTDFDDGVSSVHLSKDGKKVMYCRGAGDLWIAKSDFSEPRKLVSSWSKPYYAWSSDGSWVAFSMEDNHNNRDVWIMPVDGSREPFNVSRNPEWDGSPAWSPNGKVLAWCGKNMDKSFDIFYVYLNKTDALESSRDRKLESARKAMKARKAAGTAKKKPPVAKPPAKTPAKTTEPDPGKSPKAIPAAKAPTAPAKARPADPAAAKSDPPTVAQPTKPSGDKPPAKPTPKPAPKKVKTMTVDFDQILRRVRRISTKGINEHSLLWSPDSKRMIFRNSSGTKGTYQMVFPDNLKPTLISKSMAAWFKFDARGTTLYGMDKGLPVMLRGTKLTAIPFTCMMETSVANENRRLFNKIWRVMRDRFYRQDMNGCDWQAIYKKYLPMATQVPDKTGFQRMINLMLGELNASHTGFSFGRTRKPTQNAWTMVTSHLGLIFDTDFDGPGLKVKSIVHDGPAFRSKVKFAVGDVVLKINGTEVSNAVDWYRVLNGPGNKPFVLLVKDEKGKEKTASLVPTSYRTVRSLLYGEQQRHREKLVKEKGGDRLGYIYVASMNWGSFEKFQKEIFARGFGKDGLIIDVRDNGGGFTADHLLTVLTQPRHAATVSRGAGKGYPLDRSVYTYWHKPIVVLCNQNSFSNAEIFCHAIKTLKRGKLVGVQTGGGVISTGATSVDGKGILRLPFRGWYLLDGKDMELNGAKPDYEVWPEPGDTAKGIDRQLEKAVKVLLKQVK